MRVRDVRAAGRHAGGRTAEIAGLDSHYGIAETGEDGLPSAVPVPDAGGPCRVISTADLLLSIRWEPLSVDPEGKILKRAAWAYLAAIEPGTIIIVEMS